MIDDLIASATFAVMVVGAVAYGRAVVRMARRCGFAEPTPAIPSSQSPVIASATIPRPTYSVLLAGSANLVTARYRGLRSKTAHAAARDLVHVTGRDVIVVQEPSGPAILFSAAICSED